jgi:hypothetical protein
MSSSNLQHVKPPNEAAVPTRNIEQCKKCNYKALFTIACIVACLPTNIAVFLHLLEQKNDSIHHNQNVANFSGEVNGSFVGQHQPPKAVIGDFYNRTEQVQNIFNLI